jgi:hypothetical protein
LYFPEEFLGPSVSNNNNNNNNNKPGKHDIKELQKTAILGTGHFTNIKENIEHGN